MEKTLPLTKFILNNKILYVKAFWQPNESDLFNIIIYDGEVTWSGRFSYDFAKKYQERCNETLQQYVSNVKSALVKDNNFSYSFTLLPDDSACATFSWKKKIKQIDTVLHGSVLVHREEAKESKDLILEFLLAENRDLRSVIESVNVSNAELSADLDKCKNDLDKFVDIKTSLEMSLYGKFAQLLCAKKRRMELLETNLKDFTKSNVNQEVS